MYKRERGKTRIVDNSLKKAVEVHHNEIMSAVKDVVESGWFVGGEKIKKFEESFADYLGVSYVIGVASGTDALQLALRVCGINPGDKVATVSHTAVATVAAIELTGAIPVFIDIEADSFTMNPNHLKQVMEFYCNENSIKAVIVVHLYGQPANIREITEIAEGFGAFVIEDCAQAHGASVEGKKCGTWGKMSAFSFYPTKNLGCLGDGGAISANDPALAYKACQMREYGWKERYISELPGMNTRLDAIQASVLSSKLEYLDIENEKRREYAKLYDESLECEQIKIPLRKKNYYHVYHQYVIKIEHRDSLRLFLLENGISTAILYPLPVHMQPTYKDRVPFEKDSLINTESVYKKILSLPIAPWLSIEDIEYTIEIIKKWHYLC